MMKFSTPSVRRYFLVFALGVSLFLTAFQEPAQTGGISPWVWFVVIVILLLLVAWGVLRSMRQAPSVPERPERIEADLKPTPATPDDLAIIEGIGPKIALVLQSGGITTFNQLAATDVNRLREILEKGGIRLADPRTWPEQARLAAAGDQAGLMALQDRLKAGRQI